MQQITFYALILFGFSFVTPLRAGAAEFGPYMDQCGQFKVAGVFQKTGEKRVLKVFAGSQSETTLQVLKYPLALDTMVGKTVTATGMIRAPIHKYRGEIEISDVKWRVPDPLRGPQAEGFKILRIQACADTFVEKTTSKKGK